MMLDEMRRLLDSRVEDLPPALLSEYDCSGLFPELEGMLLAKRGGDEAGVMHLCEQCDESLQKHKVPKFSIKDGFCIGRLPADFDDVTLPERLMTQLVSVIAVTRAMRGGAHRAIQSHCLIFDATPGPTATLLPSQIDDATAYRVVLAGPFTTTQQARIRKMHRVRRQTVDNLLRFYCTHNTFYAGVRVDCSTLPDECISQNVLCEAEDADIDADAIDLDSDRVGGMADRDATDAEDEIVERRVVFVSEDREVSTETACSVEELSSEASALPQFLVRHSSRFASNDKHVFAKMFPHLFPYGRGHPGEARRVPVLLEACVRHYCLLSSRRFAEDALFNLVSFDHISLQQMYTQIALKCRRNPTLLESYSDVSEAQLLATLRDKELRRQGRTAACRDDAASARRLLKTVELSGGAVRGSDAERAQCRRQAFAYQARFGQPALFATLTPNVSKSFVMAQYAGVASVDTLFDAELAETPGRSVLQAACVRNDVASALLFMRNIDAFIEHVLGVCPTKTKSKSFHGLFGDAKAYYGMVETQGGGTLHAHFLVWLAAAPPNCEAFDRTLSARGDEYHRDIEAYTDSVVSTSLALDIADSTCQYCGHSYADLETLPLPGGAYRSTDRGRGGPKAEPLLVQCAHCKTKTSSQHILRRVLLEHRPSSWPPPLRDDSADELAAATAREASCRGSMAEARSAIFRRDLYLASRDDDDDEEGDHLRLLKQAPQRSERRQDDAFRHDSVAAAILTSPVSTEDARWSSQAFAFAVSLLVFLLNLHWWSHVGSCFKKARGAAPGICRFGFPRARIDRSTSSCDGVTVARRAACDYVNGYNRVMMAAFKSNHDVQVMIGGVASLLRIYYATKYVTKLQELVESVTAVALAAFQRRRAREVLGQSSTDQNALPPERASIGRKRVASLAFALTNRREVAGPLAALFLMRGSCCFMSNSCATLPLIDVLKELTHDETHVCDLVQLRDTSAEAMYRPASLLDDYRYRPRVLDRLCLYEFVMHHFRRKRTQSTAASSLFLPAHPLKSTHCVGTHQREAAPVIAGIRMPYVDSESPAEIVVRRSRCALALFKPFRAAVDLVSEPASDAAWVQAYHQWEPTRSSFAREIMANMDEYHRVNKEAKDAAMAYDDEPDATRESELTGTRSDVDAMADSRGANTDDPATAEDCELCDLDNFNIGEEMPVFPTSATGDAADSASAFRALLRSSAEATANSFAYLSQSTDRAIEGFTEDEYKRWIEDASTDRAAPSEAYRQESPAEVIDLLTSALESASTSCRSATSGDRREDSVGRYASVADVSQAFTLNERQHAAIVLIATALLRRFLRQERNGLDPDHGGYTSQTYQAELRDEQLLMFLGGAGGTGKSRVVDAVDAFCASWHRESALVKTALTGKAATLIGARTLASFLMRIKHAIRDKRFGPLDALVVDEVSMMSKREWLQLDKLLCAYKQVLDVPFGGVHIVLVGDFLQMPPVGGEPIYIDPHSKKRPSTTDVEAFQLWRRFTTVVVLVDSVRFRNDPDWGEGCRNARVGVWTPEFVDMTNSRVRSPDAALEGASASTVFVTPENAKRLAINNAFVAETAKQLPAGVYPTWIVANFKGSLNNLSRSDVTHVMSLPDNRFGRMALYLDLVDGMPVQVTQNVATPKGVANGTLGTLDSVHFPRATTFRLMQDGATGTIVQLPNQRPDYALLRLPRPRALPLRPGLDAELFPVFATAEPFAKPSISLPAAPN